MMERSPPPPYSYKAEAGPASERTPLLPPPPSYTPFKSAKSAKTPQKLQDGYEPHRRQHRSCKAFLLAAILIVLLGFLAGYSLKSLSRVEAPIRVAIIGAGPAGISVAHTISLLTSHHNPPVKVTIIERAPQIGGRLFLSTHLNTPSLTTFQRKIYAEDTAHSNLVSGNPILSLKCEKVLGLKKAHNVGDKAVKVGFWDGGRGFRSVQMRPLGKTSWGDWFHQALRYGAAVVWNAKRLPTGTMRKWRSMLWKYNEKMESVEDWVRTGGMGGAVALSAKERLAKNRIGGGYVNDVIDTVLRRQFGQGVEEVSDLALSMGFERELGTPSSILGGWKLGDVLQGFLDRSGADLQLNTKVTSLQKNTTEEGKLEWFLDTTGDETTQIFDKVILAAPWNTTSFLSSREKERTEQLEYRSQWQTIVVSSGKLKGSLFSTQEDQLPDQILPIASSSGLPEEMIGVSSIALLRPLFGPDIASAPTMEAISYLYAITSSHAIPASTIELLFGKEEVREWFTEEIPNAFPLLYPRTEGFGGFEVDEEGLWHTGVSEAVGSGVDWSWAVGERVGGMVAGALR